MFVQHTYRLRMTNAVKLPHLSPRQSMFFEPNRIALYQPLDFLLERKSDADSALMSFVIYIYIIVAKQILLQNVFYLLSYFSGATY